MGARIKRLLISQDFTSIFENEAWFSYMSGLGWHLKGIGVHWAEFEKGQPMDICYRVDIPEQETAAKQRKEYKKSGWEYVDNNREFYVFRMPGSLQPCQSYTDHAEQEIMLEKINQHKKVNIKLLDFSFLISVISAVCLIIWKRPDKTPILSFIEGYGFFILVNIFWLICMFLRWSGTYCKLLRMGRIVRANGAMIKEINWAAKRIRQVTGCFVLAGTKLIVFGSFLIYSIVFLYVSVSKNNQPFASAVSRDIPVVRLYELEHDSADINWNLDGPSGTWDQSWSPIAPVQYYANEKIFYAPDNSKNYIEGLCYISTSYYKLLMPGLCIPAAEEIQKRMVMYNKEWKFDIYENTNFDMVYLCEPSEKIKLLIIIKNSQIMDITYVGNQTASELLDLCANIL